MSAVVGPAFPECEKDTVNKLTKENVQHREIVANFKERKDDEVAKVQLWMTSFQERLGVEWKRDEQTSWDEE